MYKFNSLVGKIVSGATPIAQGLKPAAAETSKIIYESPNVKFPKITSAFVKPSKSGLGEVPEVLREKYKRYQEQFFLILSVVQGLLGVEEDSIDDGVPVHLKGGSTDAAMYYTTLVMCAIGIEECFRYYYQASFPKKE